MVEVTLKFDSVDLAIVALGKLVGVAQSGKRALQAQSDKTTAMSPAGSVRVTESGSATNAGPSTVLASVSAAPAAAQEKAPRKPRADKGQPRGSYAPRTEANAAGGVSSGVAVAGTAVAAAPDTDPRNVGQQPATATSTVGSSPAAEVSTAAPKKEEQTQAAAISAPGAHPPTSAAAATPVKLEDAQKALATLLEKTSYEVCTGVLAGFGVARLRELAPEKFAEFVAYANDLIAKAPAKAAS